MAKTQFEPSMAHAQAVSREEITARLQDPSLILINVLPRDTFALGHIPRSINLPLAEIETRAPQLLPDRNREIAVYCAGPT
jgi:ArsR family transcriptional regulator